MSQLTTEPLAHLSNDLRPHLLSEHLAGVGRLAQLFGDRLGSGDWARLAGLWHDLGKYAGAFQKMIREENGVEAHIEGDASGPRDHSTAGAVLVLQRARQEGREGEGLPVAFAIAGHHAGLADLADLRDRLKKKGDCLDRALAGRPPQALLEHGLPSMPAFAGTMEQKRRRLELWTRMLFSALCDADFLDTEAFFDTGRTALRGNHASIATLGARLSTFLDVKEAGATPSEVNRVRAEVRQACIAASARTPGVFSLTVPTGGGKTLAGLAFALEHARTNGLDRVVVAIPFTSITEQSAKVYRDALGTDDVLEHHSALDVDTENPRNRISSENWDAPVVVTTTVQLFESLFANRPRDCRKLHRLARSVIVLDEAQTLPPGLLEPILDVLQQLVQDFGATLVICTATQPALARRPALSVGFERIEEIVPADVCAFERLRRVRVLWPPDTSTPTAYPVLAQALVGERDVLAIVHRRKDARLLCEELDRLAGSPSTVHLSALMCPRHRSRVLARIKEEKLRGEQVRLVSTQLVEAGVDVDFRVVYRALGGLDSLAQAAGRCNREGRLDGLGELRVFVAPTEPPPGVPATALGITRGMLAVGPVDLFDPETHRRFFELLYGFKNLDEKAVQKAREGLQFRTVAGLVRLVEDDWSAPVIVPYDGAAERVAELERLGPSRARLRALQPFSINVPKRMRSAWLASGAAREVAESVVVIEGAMGAAYDERFGLVLENVGLADPALLVA